MAKASIYAANTSTTHTFAEKICTLVAGVRSVVLTVLSENSPQNKSFVTKMINNGTAIYTNTGRHSRANSELPVKFIPAKLLTVEVSNAPRAIIANVTIAATVIFFRFDTL